jgi:hypothetical protein
LVKIKRVGLRTNAAVSCSDAARAAVIIISALQFVIIVIFAIIELERFPNAMLRQKAGGGRRRRK